MEGKLEVGIINGSIWAKSLMLFRLQSELFLMIVNVFLDVFRAILRNFGRDLLNIN